MRALLLAVLSAAVLCGCARPAPVDPRLPTHPLQLFHSRVSGPISVAENGSLRVLLFGNGTTQTVVDFTNPTRLISPYAQAVLLAFCFQERDPARLEGYRYAMIGLGGGAIPRFLRKHFPKMVIDAVELDPLVVDLAKRFFFVAEDERYRIHVADGKRFLELTASRFDTLLVDALDGDTDEVPASLSSEEFLRTAATRLTARGLVVMNTIPRDPARHALLLQAFRRVFRHVSRLYPSGPGGGNVVIVASNQNEHARALAELSERARTLEGYLRHEVRLTRLLAPDRALTPGRPQE